MQTPSILPLCYFSRFLQPSGLCFNVPLCFFPFLKKPILLIYLFIFHWVWSSVPGLEQGLETNPRACLPLHACCVHFQKTLLKSAWNQNGPYFLFLMHIPSLIVKDLSMLVFYFKDRFFYSSNCRVCRQQHQGYGFNPLGMQELTTYCNALFLSLLIKASG